MLSIDSIKWAIQFTQKQGDGDLFPRLPEMDAIVDMADELSSQLSKCDLSQLPMGVHRRFIVPKDELSYRQATQLDPQDNIILTAIMYQYGNLIETRRLDDNTVFSYRFQPDTNNGLYMGPNRWNQFWVTACEKGKDCRSILYCDISDFYNQIYHHTIENQLIESGFPNQENKWIIRLLESTTAGVSRGIPVGPHATHLLAEASMIPIDESLRSQGVDFIRYVDDIIVFCTTELQAQKVVAQIASTLDRQQRLVLQRHKTKIFKAAEFNEYCSNMIEDRPISAEEDEVLQLINKYAVGDPYRTVYYSEIKDEDWNSITDSVVTSIISEYLTESPVDYARLRWFYRRLAQIGHPGGIDVTLANIDKLTPCLANVCVYLGSVQRIEDSKWMSIGDKILGLLENEIVKSNEYFRLLLMSLFAKNKPINHFSSLVRQFGSSEPFIRREIILSAKQNRAFDWLRELKESFPGMDQWQQMAYLYSISGLPKEERKYLIHRATSSRALMQTISNWSKEQ